ncbi:MAG: HIT family protein [Candidatus Kapaibacteriota bacterium]
MDFLWSPWRSSYIDDFKDEKNKQKEICFFCEALKNSNEDDERLVVVRRDNYIILLNKFPYTSGHLLIAPNRHIGDYTLLNDNEILDISLAIKECVVNLKEAFQPQGFNIGVNIGNVAGAGLPGHIHYHIVPRWAGDKNFMYVTGETNVISFSNEMLLEKLRPLFQKKNK